ncbi:hypothetical protein B0H14DRAFT_2567708 [Mycena olivaceomarginata]|nr:hypothetical protein B0H14DRAFT_2567708 [Mycena olivaceomarginata]
MCGTLLRRGRTGRASRRPGCTTRRIVEDEEGRGYGYARGGQSMDVAMVLDEDDDVQEQADVDAMDQDLLVPQYDNTSGSEHGERDAIRGRATSPEVIEIDEPVPPDSEPDGVCVALGNRHRPSRSSRAAQAGEHEE